MKRPVRILLILLGTVIVGALVVIANVSKARSDVKGIEVKIRYRGVSPLVDEQTVRDTILALIPTLMQNALGQVDCHQVAQAAAHVPYLDRVAASTSMSGRVVVRAIQRRPIARLYDAEHQYYLDATGRLLPALRHDSLNVLVAGGAFPEPLQLDSITTDVMTLWQVAAFLDGQKKYGDLIDQIYLEADGDLMMVPKLGNHVVELGPLDGLEEKFDALLAFYRRGMPRAGWDTYNRISLKYDGQVVATRR